MPATIGPHLTVKTPLIILASCFAVSLAASAALRFTDNSASPPRKYPEITLKRLLTKADVGEVTQVKIIRYANNPDLVALAGQWSPDKARSVSIVARGRLTSAEQERLAARNY